MLKYRGLLAYFWVQLSKCRNTCLDLPIVPKNFFSYSSMLYNSTQYPTFFQSAKLWVHPFSFKWTQKWEIIFFLRSPSNSLSGSQIFSNFRKSYSKKFSPRNERFYPIFGGFGSITRSKVDP